MHKVSGRSSLGNAVSTVVEGSQQAVAKAHEFLADGFTDIMIGKLDEKEMPLEEFEAAASAPPA
jgi:hypothetical protein